MDSTSKAHVYSLDEMAEILDCSKGYISRRAREGKDVKKFPVSDFAITDGGGRLKHFRVPHDAFEEADADQRENTADDADHGEARENASVTVEVNTDAADDQEEEKEEEEQERQPMPNGKGKGAPSLLSSFAALGGAVTLLGLFGSSDKK